MLQTKEKVYKLDAQVLAEEGAGQKVKVVGSLDAKTGTITVGKIEAEAAGPNGLPKPISTYFLSKDFKLSNDLKPYH